MFYSLAMIICGIETSCDETSVAILKDKNEVLSDIIYSQIDDHKIYGGVVPEIASRKHVELIDKIFLKSLKEASINISMIDKYAVTYGPGLVGALLVGVSFAKALAYSQKKELIPINHIHAHIYANFIGTVELKPPFITLLVSGGHTQIIDFQEHDRILVMGETRDDAAGEAFDKIARVLGLGYPGGPAIDKKAMEGDPVKYIFPKASFSDNIYDFSFSGPKTSVINLINTLRSKGASFKIEDICASFQKSVIDILVEKAVLACINKGYNRICLAGGVAANSYLRKNITDICKKSNIAVSIPEIKYCTDNAAMVAQMAFYTKEINDDFLRLNAMPNLMI